ncbi:UNVERIFIED_CONTAM: Pentatricopeptide repeat-containing protein [Sesamum latifolium]|uniref:Pentatricopeptide repeat-containing protein n=1 Tax=Sesamum latifolium TaxID=2727402 RepID=A0AAW2YBE5_9LAMI
MSCKPNVYAYNTVVDGLCKDKMADDALHLFSRMIERGISPNVVTYSSFRAYVLLVDGKMSRTCSMKWSITRYLQMCGLLIYWWMRCARKEWWKTLRIFLEVMMQRNIYPEIITYDTLIDGYCLRGQMGKAKGVLYSIADRGLTPCIISYNSLINGYCK